ncbi:MAG: PilZ domain-containing protein [Terriglobales bacterium]
MSYLPDGERRQHVRFPQVLEVHARSLRPGPAAGPEPKGPKEFDCRLHNLSNGGVCILSSSPLQASTFVCCNFQVFDSPVAIPALMQVRWTVKRGQKSPSYISGLEFVV